MLEVMREPSHRYLFRETREAFPEALSAEKARLAFPVEAIGTQRKDRFSGEEGSSFGVEFGGLGEQ